MKIFLGTDHAGFKLKEKLKAYLIELGYEIQDMGNFIYDEQDDYPDFIPLVAGKVAEDPEHSRGIVLGGSGQGEAMVANRIKGVRAAVVYNYNEDIVKLSREHNDANILSLGARFLSEEEAKKIVKLWLETPFSNEERHKRRICKLSQL
ncbi:RpiB/LacA/LacB family sugar-phosphate isomerase [Patescibacteria group bacterium]|nr:RpiB/LacA/LacB family sugar-phosphate isomerase [Patescibacteria group bacterium]